MRRRKSGIRASTPRTPETAKRKRSVAGESPPSRASFDGTVSANPHKTPAERARRVPTGSDGRPFAVSRSVRNHAPTTTSPAATKTPHRSGSPRNATEARTPQSGAVFESVVARYADVRWRAVAYRMPPTEASRTPARAAIAAGLHPGNRICPLTPA
jgi:hypothetical protein